MILAITMNPAIDKIYFVDNYQLGQVHRPKSTIASPGGKGLNVARVARIMGETVIASGPLGGGNGAFIRENIKVLGIEDGFSNISGETRICINVTDPLTGKCTEVLETGPEITEEEVKQYFEKFTQLIAQVEVVTISGSLPKGIKDDFYRNLIEIANKEGRKVLLDTSGSAFIKGLEAKPYIIKPNEDEIRSIYQGPLETDEDLVQAIKYFKDMGIVCPIITRGKAGSLAGLSDGVYRVTNAPVKVVNSVGSGDSFIAGCAIGLSRGYKEVDMIRMGAACGTANTQYPQTGFVEKEMVESFFKEICVEKIADY